ncbi:MAG: chorismate mutase [Eggerthellaceae bacterium]|nr:chorismate mutase [Eggerthellaceae bacterium]
MNLNEARETIREVDEQMAPLFVRRMEAVREVAAYKKAHGLPVEDLEQEARVIEGRSSLVTDDDIRPFYIRFLQDTMNVSKQWQQRLLDGMRVAYSGVEGAFAYMAAKRIFPNGTPVSHTSFEEAYEAVVSGSCDVAVLPIENSYAGEVGQVLDLMFAGSLYVNGVYDFPIVQNLMGMPDAHLEDVKTVISHPQALAQCRNYIADRGLEEIGASNTAVAAQEVAKRNDPSLAAIANDETAKLYGLKILDHDINESRTNTTRFAVFSRAENRSTAEKDSDAFLLLFTVKDEAGGLAKALNVISVYNFNMRVLRSRPMKDLPWHYYFYVEAEGNDASENGQRMISALQGICPHVKVVGRYKTATEML